MKIVEFINKLREIGYDENTELTFSCVDRNTGECYDLLIDEFCYGEDLTGQPYHNDIIDIGINVDDATSYVQAKSNDYVSDMIDELQDVLNKHDPWRKVSRGYREEC